MYAEKLVKFRLLPKSAIPYFSVCSRLAVESSGGAFWLGQNFIIWCVFGLVITKVFAKTWLSSLCEWTAELVVKSIAFFADSGFAGQHKCRKNQATKTVQSSEAKDDHRGKSENAEGSARSRTGKYQSCGTAAFLS